MLFLFCVLHFMRHFAAVNYNESLHLITSSLLLAYCLLLLLGGWVGSGDKMFALEVRIQMMINFVYSQLHRVWNCHEPIRTVILRTGWTTYDSYNGVQRSSVLQVCCLCSILFPYDSSEARVWYHLRSARERDDMGTIYGRYFSCRELWEEFHALVRYPSFILKMIMVIFIRN